MKNLDKIFFNSVEEMNECYSIDAELPRGLHSNADLVCYEIVNPFVYDEICQYKFEEGGLECFSFGQWCGNLSNTDNEILLNKHDLDNFEGRCFVYVRVNEHLRKHLERTLIGCEFVCKGGAKYQSERRFVKNISKFNLVYDQDGFCTPLENILLYPDDYSDHIPYKEWVKKINEQDVEG